MHICLGQVRWFVSMSANIWLLKWRVLPFKVSLADVMHKKRSFRVWSRVTYPQRWTISHLHWVVHAWPFSSRLTPRRSLHVHDCFSPQGSMGLPCYLATWPYCQRAKGREVRLPTVPFGHGGKTPCFMFDVISDGIYLGFYFVFYGEYSSLFIFSSR